MAPGSADGVDAQITEPYDDENTEQKIINEEYKTWKKNSPFLYDMILSTALEWPTLTTQWFPDAKSYDDKNFTTHRLLLGTHTSGDAPNYLQIANVQLPNSNVFRDRDYDEDRKELGGHGSLASAKAPEVKMTIEQKIDHPGEINKARYQPQNPNIIATMCIDGRVLIFDRTKHSSLPKGVTNPQLQLLGHKEEGFGLCWNPHQAGQLVTGSGDKTVRLWDLTTAKAGSTELKASRVYTHHTAGVNDVQYHPQHSSLVASVADDNTVQILDLRKEDYTKSAVTGYGHDDAVNAVAFNPASDYILATGSSDKSIGIWDLRNFKNKVHSLEGHNESVTSLSWHPFEEAVLASGGADRRVIFWDLSRVGEEVLPDDQEDGPPELLFMHAGHTNCVSDFSWNPTNPWVVCSAAEDNLIQIWKVAETIVGKDPEDVQVDELER